MFFRKYFAFVEATFPWFFCCVLTWWLDRLLVEFGHRNTDSPTCTHNNLQYVRWHQFVTLCAVKAQMAYVILIRKKQFMRELTLVGVVAYEPCLFHIYALQGVLCVSWATLIACLIDISPWLCITNIVEHRATIATIAIGTVIATLIVEHKLWAYTLQRAIDKDPNSIEI